MVRFWRILKDDILDIQENKPDFCKHFQKVAEELMLEYSIVGEPYRTNPLLPDNWKVFSILKFHIETRKIWNLKIMR